MPLAGRVGMQNFRDELEDLAFAEVNEGRELIVGGSTIEARWRRYAGSHRL